MDVSIRIGMTRATPSGRIAAMLLPPPLPVRICKVLIAGKGAEILKFASTFHVPIAKEQFTSGAIKIKTECIRIFPYKNVLCEEPLGVRATVLFLL